MSSQRRIDASRANGAISHGPVTPEGKLICSQNATRHGLTANTVVVTNESHDKFEALMQNYIEELRPASPIQMDLVEQMSVAKWRQRRVWSAETATFDLAMDRQQESTGKEFERVDQPTRLAMALESTAHSGMLTLLHRYETSLRRSWERAFDRLASLQAAERSRESSLSRARQQAESLEQSLAQSSAEFRNRPNPNNEQ